MAILAKKWSKAEILLTYLEINSLFRVHVCNIASSHYTCYFYSLMGYEEIDTLSSICTDLLVTDGGKWIRQQ